MSGANPYEAPKAAVESPTEFQKVRLLSISGRIGRALYVVWILGLWVVFALVEDLYRVFAWPTAIVLFAFFVMLTIQRCHDIGASGWATTLLGLPVLNLVLWFLPGSQGPNRFGAPPPPNGIVVLVLLWLFSIAYAVVILAIVVLLLMAPGPR